jgi:hypothetical protein
MRKVSEVTTEQIREATSKGFVASLGYKSISDTQFDLWFATERNRVADLAIAKERKRIFVSIMANVNKVVEAAKRGDSQIDMTWLFEEIMKEDQ